uniref:Protein INVOLVED IN DE NOVO 2-like isoform X1 n=1 Tax=Rhizophora mucronata TaxID=61149 RepID=A0A2P2LS93_RHIMU
MKSLFEASILLGADMPTTHEFKNLQQPLRVSWKIQSSLLRLLFHCFSINSTPSFRVGLSPFFVVPQLRAYVSSAGTVRLSQLKPLPQHIVNFITRLFLQDLSAYRLHHQLLPRPTN